MPVIPIDHIPLRNSEANLDISGVAGFFGGDVAVSAMGTVSLYKGRKWFGWYNSPGSYEIAKRYGRLARHRFWCGLYPGGTDSPAALFELDGRVGPRYRAVHSGTSMDQTGHLAYLLGQECKNRPAREVPKGRETIATDVTIAYLRDTPPVKMTPRAPDVSVTSLLSFLPILPSICACLLCAFVDDWNCFSMIALGMFCSGVSCLVIGRGIFTFTHPKPAQGAPPGDGILTDNEQVIILLGEEGAVNAVTRGRFSLRYESHPNYHDIGGASLLLTAQFLIQLLVVPQGTIFGQVLFLSSLGASWVFNSFLSSLDKENIQRRILIKEILKEPEMHKYRLGTRTTMVVFVMLVLSSSQPMDEHALRKLLDHMLPNDTRVWCSWKDTVVREIHLRSEEEEPAFWLPGSSGFNDGEVLLLNNLYLDARTAYRAFSAYKGDKAQTEQSQRTDSPTSEELDEKDLDKTPEVNVEATPALGYYHDRAVDESLRRTISRSSTATFVNNWHNVRSPTIDNWHGCD